MPDFAHEAEYDGAVIGIDEAGRGPWAGPVTASAIWLGTAADRLRLPVGIDDSKKLKPASRASLAAILSEPPFFSHTVSIGANVIDQIGILQATFRAMTEAAQGLSHQMQEAGLSQPIHALVDGNLLPTAMPVPATALVKGDQSSLSIAAASILAKATRDSLMFNLHQTWPHYGWDRNMGYGTKAHSAGLDAYGVSPHHRHSFKPIQRYLDVTRP